MSEGKGLGPGGLRKLCALIRSALAEKVDKQPGKGLSTEDYTSQEKTKLSGLDNYSLPTASETIKGGVKIGSGLAMYGDVLYATGGGGSGGVPVPGPAGKDGVTFTPSVSQEGLLTWTNDGERENPDPVNLKGPQGEDGAPGKEGAPGPAGQAAGFGEITATVDAYSGTPSVEVTADGPDTKKAFHFAFHNLKGQDGSGGGSGGGIGTVTATVDHTSGNPQVKVSQSGSDFRLDFTGINGEDGAPGERGQDGKDGQAGQAGQDGTTFTPSVDGEGNLSWTNDGNKENPETINIRGPKGEDGKDGAAGEPGQKGADATVETEEITIQPSQWQGDAAAGYTASAACTIATPDNALFCAPRISSKQEYDQFSAAGMAVTGQSQGAVTLACYAGKPEKAVSIFVMAAVVKGA